MDIITSAVSIHMANNLKYDIITGSEEDTALKLVNVIGNPNLTQAYLINLEQIGVKKGLHGDKDYNEAFSSGSVEFGVTDVFIVDEDRVVYYVKGIVTNNGRAYTAKEIKDAQADKF